MSKKSLIKYGVAALVLAAAAIALVTVVSIKPMEKEEEGMGLTVDPYPHRDDKQYGGPGG